MSINPLKLAGQVLVAAVVMAFIGTFGSSNAPAYRYFEPDQAMLKISVSHASQRKDACHKRSAEELAKLAPNMRAAQQCSRERVPVLLEADLDGKPLLSQLRQPSGLSKDGSSTFYHFFRIPAGTHTLVLRMRESARTEGFDYVEEHTLDIHPLSLLVVNFSREDQGFTIRR